jgi:Holin of 3TMs, for gene-transfer release
MDKQFNDVAGALLRQGLPVLAGLLLGNPAKVLTGALANVLADALGVPNNAEAIEGAIASATQPGQEGYLDKLRGVELEHKEDLLAALADKNKTEVALAEIEARTSSTAIQADMQVRLAEVSGSWYQRAARPIMLYAIAFSFTFVVCSTGVAIAQGREVKGLGDIALLFATLAPFVLSYSMRRDSNRVAAMTGQVPTTWVDILKRN